AIDRCMECGFCEKVCPSRDLTLTPRQRIVSLRSMELLKHSDKKQYKALQKAFEYKGAQTCAATGMCAEVCPVGINTGLAIKNWRANHVSLIKHSLLKWAANHQALSLKLIKWGLNVSGKTPKPKQSILQEPLKPGKMDSKTVILFPSCSCRMLDNSNESQPQLLKVILAKLGYNLIVPDLANECCGLMYQSEGAPDIAKQKHQSLYNALLSASENGKWPIITENASCALEFHHAQFNLKLLDSWKFLSQALEDYPLIQKDRKVMLHVNCSVSRLKEKEQVIKLARRCAKEVIIPPDIYCCGFAGSKGFSTPELNRNALKTLASQVPDNCREGYTCLQACEIGLSKHSGILYNSLLNLINESMQ
ncbi:MAG: linked oxidase domain protein, partial [Gammaproteobacteria bacterium]|nr:linked oxidase domain protein [Gammaproteobacteria bacterium]